MSYQEALLAAAARPSLAAFVRAGVGTIAVGAPRALRAWADLDAPGRWFVVLPYDFPAVPGRAWDLAGAAGLPLGDPRPPPSTPQARTVSPAWDRAGHIARVRAALDAIAAGAVYELNLACTWTVALAPHPHPDLALHLALLAADPAAFACVARGGGPAIVGNSPELFLAVQGGTAITRPIKGTRRRLPGREAEQRAELDASAKERAELNMIVDLCRHDLGRVAVPGGVRVDDPGSIIDLPRLHHRVAQVSARLRPATPLSAVVAACFPAGSITGAPKLAAMRHIATLERSSRGHWCGAYGTVGDGACELAVAIRTAELDGERLLLRAGGGIVADSDPAAEWDEARAKAQGIAAALGAEV